MVKVYHLNCNTIFRSETGHPTFGPEGRVRFPPSCRRSESGDGRLTAAAAAITVFVSVQWPKLGREQTVCLCAWIAE